MKWMKGTCQCCGKMKKVALSTSLCWQCSHEPLPSLVPVKCKYCPQFDLPDNMHRDICTGELYHEKCAKRFTSRNPTNGSFSLENSTVSYLIEKETINEPY